MEDDQNKLIPTDYFIESIKAEIEGSSSSRRQRILEAIALAALGNISMIGIAPADNIFTQTNNCPTTLNPNTNCTITVIFTPPDSGNFSETLSVTDSDKNSPQAASLSGVGLD